MYLVYYSYRIFQNNIQILLLLYFLKLFYSNSSSSSCFLLSTLSSDTFIIESKVSTITPVVALCLPYKIHFIIMIFKMFLGCVIIWKISIKLSIFMYIYIVASKNKFYFMSNFLLSII